MLSYRPKMALFRPWVPYIIVYIFAQFRPVRRHWKRRIQNSTLSRSERKDVDPVTISSRDLGHDHGHWHPSRILIFNSYILYIFPSTNTSTSYRPYIDPTSTLHRPLMGRCRVDRRSMYLWMEKYIE